MVTLDDCIALSDLTVEEIEAIAEDEHVPMIIAAELGWYRLHFGGKEQNCGDPAPTSA